MTEPSVLPAVVRATADDIFLSISLIQAFAFAQLLGPGIWRLPNYMETIRPKNVQHKESSQSKHSNVIPWRLDRDPC